MAKMASGVVFNDYVPGCDYIGDDEVITPVVIQCRLKFCIKVLKDFIKIEWITHKGRNK